MRTYASPLASSLADIQGSASESAASSLLDESRSLGDRRRSGCDSSDENEESGEELHDELRRLGLKVWVVEMKKCCEIDELK